MAESSPAAPIQSPRARSSPLHLLRRLLLCVLVAYLIVCAYLYFTQDSQIYPRAISGAILPADQALRLARQVGLSPFYAPGTGTSSLRGYVGHNFLDPGAATRGTIIVFHGNGGWARDRTAYLAAFSVRGFRTFLYEYPGYGGRPGFPRESIIVPDARDLVRTLDRARLGPIYLWGESLGSGVAAAVCRDATLPVRGLVLLTPYNSIAGVALYRYPFIPATLLLKDHYDSVQNLKEFKHPICVIRSSKDEIIPPALTLLLYASLPEPKKMIVQKGYGHENWPSEPNLSWWDDALNFIAPSSPK
jgi:fermentation-respiration switch protein FrsA (DUF1100 family)